MFAKFPGLNVVLMESGVTWLPGYLWRLTKFWKGLRSEMPWVSDPPAGIVRDRVRLTLQPFDGPPDPASIGRFMEQMGSDEMLLFSTDYPHWQFEGTGAVPAGLVRRWREKSWSTTRCGPIARLRETVHMNVDVLNRSGIQPAAQSKLAIADCDIHPRPPGAGIGGVSAALYPYLSRRWQEHVRRLRRALPPAVGEGLGLSRRGSRRPAGATPGRTAAIPAATWPSCARSTWSRTTWRSASSTR